MSVLIQVLWCIAALTVGHTLSCDLVITCPEQLILPSPDMHAQYAAQAAAIGHTLAQRRCCQVSCGCQAQVHCVMCSTRGSCSREMKQPSRPQRQSLQDQSVCRKADWASACIAARHRCTQSIPCWCQQSSAIEIIPSWIPHKARPFFSKVLVKS